MKLVVDVVRERDGDLRTRAWFGGVLDLEAYGEVSESGGFRACRALYKLVCRSLEEVDGKPEKEEAAVLLYYTYSDLQNHGSLVPYILVQAHGVRMTLAEGTPLQDVLDAKEKVEEEGYQQALAAWEEEKGDRCTALLEAKAQLEEWGVGS